MCKKCVRKCKKYVKFCSHLLFVFNKTKIVSKNCCCFFFKKVTVAFFNVVIRMFKKRIETSVLQKTFLLPVISSILLILVLFNLSRFCFFHWSLLSQPLLIQVTLQKWQSIPNGHYHFYRLHKHSGISLGVTQWGHLLTPKRKSLSTKLNSLFFI